MTRLPLALGGLLAAASLIALAPVASAQDTATVYVVHGIPGVPVDVYVDGERALDDFEPGTVTDGLALPAGPRTVTVFPADAEDDSGDPVISADADLPAGGNLSLVAHLTEDGDPVLTPFVNDVTAVPAGQARAVVRHTAAAPAVDVLAGDTVVVSGITNPDQEALEVPAGTISASVAAADTTEPVIGPADLDLQEGTATFVHAVGSLDDDTLDLVVFVIDGLQSPPTAVPSGAPSGAPSDAGVPAAVVLLGVAGIGLAGLAARRLVRR